MTKKLMGTGYEEMSTLPAEAVALPVTYRQVALDRPEPALAREEQVISDMRRGSLVSDAPVLHATDPTIAAASFRCQFDPNTRVIPAVDYSEMNRWSVTQQPKSDRRSTLSLGDTGDVPVLTKAPAPTADEALSVGVRKFRRAFGWIDDRDYPVVPRAA